jgi:hypothetical protein
MFCVEYGVDEIIELTVQGRSWILSKNPHKKEIITSVRITGCGREWLNWVRDGRQGWLP